MYSSYQNNVICGIANAAMMIEITSNAFMRLP